MSYDSSKVGHYGKLVEVWASRNYPLTLDYPSLGDLRLDATDDRGNPWDIKGSMVNSSSRSTFKFWRDQHAELADAGGGYVLVWYRARRDSITVDDSRTIRARDLKIDNWTNPGDTHYRSHTKEAQIPADALRP